MTYFLDCSVTGPDSELFIVEGKSALNALDQVRSRASQAVFALQGKLPNANTRTEQRLLQHQPTRSLLEILHHPQVGQCRFRHILLATDPDPDGHHSRWLLLALLQRFCAPLLESGRVSVVSAPIGRVASAGTGKYDYFWSEHEKQQFLASSNDQRHDITAFRGLASLSADELHYWVVSAGTRRYVTAA